MVPSTTIFSNRGWFTTEFQSYSCIQSYVKYIQNIIISILTVDPQIGASPAADSLAPLWSLLRYEGGTFGTFTGRRLYVFTVRRYFHNSEGFPNPHRRCSSMNGTALHQLRSSSLDVYGLAQHQRFRFIFENTIAYECNVIDWMTKVNIIILTHTHHTWRFKAIYVNWIVLFNYANTLKMRHNADALPFTTE